MTSGIFDAFASNAPDASVRRQACYFTRRLSGMTCRSEQVMVPV
jgi:hypothetical protein